MRQMFWAVAHLHRQNICHRDIKPENFLISHLGRDAEVKLTDFGLSIKYSPEQLATTKFGRIVGTPFYVAPEVLAGSYDQRCDNWSVGVV